MLVDSTSDDIIYSNLFTGVHGNYLRGSIAAAEMDPDNLAESDPSAMDFLTGSTKAWRDVWGSGQGIGAIKSVGSLAEIVARRKSEYDAAASAGVWTGRQHARLTLA